MTSSPWHHPDSKALATALGVTTRSLTAWAKAGAPIPATGPCDELAVRLWHAANLDAKAKPLTAPTGALAPYADALAELRTASAKRGGDNPSDALKRAQRQRVDLLNAEKRKQLLTQAQDHVKTVLGRADQELRAQLLTPGTISQLHGYCRGTLAEAERHLIPLMRGRITAAITTALAHGEQRIEGA